MGPRVLSVDPTPGETPRIVHRDADVVVVDKPAGWLTHPDGTQGAPDGTQGAPDGTSGSGGGRPDVFTFLGGAAAALGVHQRLDIDTSGLLAFSTSSAGAKRLAAAFEGGGPESRAKKRYLAVLEGELPAGEGRLTGEVPAAPERQAETRYRVLRRHRGQTLVEAEPVTGRTHQLRAHFAAAGAPVRGDQRYGDPLDVRAPRLLLHCHRLELPGVGAFEAPPPPEMGVGDPAALRAGLRADAGQTCFRVLNGEGDDAPGWQVDAYGEWLWAQRDDGAPERELPGQEECSRGGGIYRIDGLRDRSHTPPPPPRLVAGVAAPAPLVVRENGIAYHVVLGPSLSTGLFLDQRPQRAWMARNARGARVLNTFAHAGGFTVAAAVGGAARTVSVDLSREWLARIGPQLAENDLTADPLVHDTIHGDVFDWLRRLSRRGERFDIVIVDPPSTSVGAKGRRWSAARDYTDLVRLAAPLVEPGGWLLTITNHRGLSPGRFSGLVRAGLPGDASLERVSPMPVDFPSPGQSPTKSLLWRMGARP